MVAYILSNNLPFSYSQQKIIIFSIIIYAVVFNHFINVDTFQMAVYFVVCTSGLFYCFYMAMRADPGFLKTTPAEQKKVEHTVGGAHYSLTDNGAHI